jgi:hypothetical protein
LGGLPEAFINERLGKCHLSLALIIHFFEAMSYEPGRAGPTQPLAVASICFALIADLLDLPHAGPPACEYLPDKVVNVTSDLLAAVLRSKSRHRPNVIDDVILSICSVVGRRGDEVDTAKCCRLIKKEYSDRPELLFNYAFLLGGASLKIVYPEPLSYASSGIDNVYDLTSLRVIDSSYIQNFLLGLETMVNERRPHFYSCTAAYICPKDTKYEDLPFVIEQSPGDVTFDLVPRLADTTMDTIFETPVRRNDVVVVPFTRRNIHMLQAVLVQSCENGRLTVRHVPLAAAADPPTIHDLFKIQAGKHAGLQTITSVFPGAWTPSSLVFAVDNFVDPFVASANFTIKIGNDTVVSWQPSHWKVHDWVLYERWSFFKRVIDADLVEARDRIITLPVDFPVPLLYMVLSYIYTSTFSVTNKHVDQVRSFVHQYVDFYDFGTRSEGGQVIANPGWYNFLAPFYADSKKLKSDIAPQM